MSNIQLIKPDVMGVMAKRVFQSGMFGAKNENQIYALMLISEAEGIHPMKAVQQYHIINGKPALKSNEVLARFQKSGGKVKWIQSNDEVAEATFYHEQGGEITLKWDIEKAKKAGIYDSNPTWKKYPSNMLRARLVTDGVNAVYPVCLGGAITESQAQDIPAEEVEEIEEAEVTQAEETINTEDLKRSLVAKLKKDFNFTNAIIKEFAEVNDLANNVELLEELVSSDDKLTTYVEAFEKGL